MATDARGFLKSSRMVDVRFPSGCDHRTHFVRRSEAFASMYVFDPDTLLGLGAHPVAIAWFSDVEQLSQGPPAWVDCGFTDAGGWFVGRVNDNLFAGDRGRVAFLTNVVECYPSPEQPPPGRPFLRGVGQVSLVYHGLP